MADGTVVKIDEAKLWSMADALRNNMDAAEYKHVVLGELASGVILSGVLNTDWLPSTLRWEHIGGVDSALRQDNRAWH